MEGKVTADTLHRTAKYFMDTGRAGSHGEAMGLLHAFGLNVVVGEEVFASRDHQIALLTLVNTARRTFLGGIRVVGSLACPLLVSLAPGVTLRDAVTILGGRVANERHDNWPTAIIGTASVVSPARPVWQLTWSGWRGGVLPLRYTHRLAEKNSTGLGPVLAAAVCAGEAFAYHARDHALAGTRGAGLSLWCPDRDWLDDGCDGPAINCLPVQLWLIGLGNLGQAYLWVLGCLDYENPNALHLMLQDFDRLAVSNDSTSLLTHGDLVGQFKTRGLVSWCERRGFSCSLDERSFGAWSRRGPMEPPVALCGVDNALARSALEDAGFGLVIETGLGAGPQSFRNLSMHVFPSSLRAANIWTKPSTLDSYNAAQSPAYAPDKFEHLDECGLARLAARTVGVPFVGLTAACLAIAELLRRMHGGQALELASLSTMSLADIEISPMDTGAYEFGYTGVASQLA